MVVHIVLWNLKEDGKQAGAAAIKSALEGLRGRIDGLERIEVNAGFSGYDLCLYSEFASREALAAYREHPLHKAAQRTVHAAMVARAHCDWEV